MHPATNSANLQKQTLQESAGLRYTGLPFTSLFAEARFEQENMATFEEQFGGDHAFVRDTDAESDLRDWRLGFYSSPNTVSLGAHYRQRHKHTDYDTTIDTAAAYPAFFRERSIDTDEIEARLTWRPITWLKTTLTYQLVDTISIPPPTPSSTTPGGRLRAGTFNADVYGLSLVLTPFSRWYFSSTFNYYDSRSFSAHNYASSIVPYKGDIYSLLATATYSLNTNTDLTASYTWSKADYAQDNFAAGLPLGSITTGM